MKKIIFIILILIVAGAVYLMTAYYLPQRAEAPEGEGMPTGFRGPTEPPAVKGPTRPSQ